MPTGSTAILDLPRPSVTDRGELVFHGLDTLATVTLDGDVLAETENMHRTYRIDVTGRSVQPSLTAFPVCHPGGRRSGTGRGVAVVRVRAPFNYVRKMACSWGWTGARR